MPLVYACIAPHGGIIPGLEGAEACAQTTAAMDELGRRMEAARPESVVVVTPHGVRVDGALAISLSERAMGSLDEPATEERAAFSVRVDLAVDGDFSRALLGGATLASVPAVGVHYGAKASERRVALVASADQAHAHAADGPYGYDPAAAQFDDWIIEAVRANDLLRLLKADMELVRRACPDALWQMLVLAGALERVPMIGELLSYERPTYFGMLVAAYAPAAITSRP